MNNVIDLLTKHRTTRNFVKGYKIDESELNSIILSARQAPTWMNGQHYSILVFTDEKIKSSIYELSQNNLHIDTSSVFLLFCLDLRHLSLASEIENKEFSIEGNIDVLLTATTDASLAMQNAVIAAESLGYGTVCCGGMRGIAKELIEKFDFPKYTYPLCGLSIGKIDETKTIEKVKPRFPIEAKVGHNKYPNISKGDVLEYNKIMGEFAETRETMSWTEKFSKFYSNPPFANTKDLLKKQGF